MHLKLYDAWAVRDFSRSHLLDEDTTNGQLLGDKIQMLATRVMSPGASQQLRAWIILLNRKIDMDKVG